MAQRPETMPQTGAVALLLRQHEEIRRLCHRVEANTGRRREEAFESLRRLLAVHETAEEQVVHPIVRRIAPRGDQIVDRLLEEEKRGKIMLRDLERMGTHDPSFPPMFARFRAAVLEHAEREEQQEFPVLSRRGQAELRGLAAAIKAAEAMAPTHPHPGVESAKSNMIFGVFASVTDRARDLVRTVTRRGRR
ncbi:hemerythrin domain-containing protein [Actinoallomurus iriomotensis]|jgi:hemerythrin superfamily protein|uniref:Hemerythrin n=1 Tax=Actinoallomurus iriomotensis TaxID=478107 RepID=A0A9W6RJX1_9ACTN|nr:hemerythrin domain-containing protein [Actinoallomurus iriomotensis]GLY77149.1 hemerythrin [Actinoallomurus iriomotensis]